MDYICLKWWGMLYADDACIGLRSSQELAKLVVVIVRVCQPFPSTVSTKKDETICMSPSRKPRKMVRAKVVWKIYKQVHTFI